MNKSLHPPSLSLQLSKAGWSVGDVDLFELNEAFAAQSLAVVRELGVDPSKVRLYTLIYKYYKSPQPLHTVCIKIMIS